MFGKTSGVAGRAYLNLNANFRVKVVPVCLPYNLSCGILLHLKISTHVDVQLYNLLMERTM